MYLSYTVLYTVIKPVIKPTAKNDDVMAIGNHPEEDSSDSDDMNDNDDGDDYVTLNQKFPC